MFRFEVGDVVRVLAHPARPAGEVVARWTGEELGDAYDENVYAVSGFITRQRESSLARERFAALPMDTLEDWRLAGFGAYRRAGPSTVEAEGGPGILWYTREAFQDFVLLVAWRTAALEDNSGVFLRIPPLGQSDPARDWQPAVEQGYEVQIDDRGVDPGTQALGSPLHLSGAIYGLAPAVARVARPAGRWNAFEIEARGPSITVRLNGVEVSWLREAAGRRLHGHLGLQTHHAGSRVQFRSLQVRPL
jgi:hypothetical protein